MNSCAPNANAPNCSNPPLPLQPLPFGQHNANAPNCSNPPLTLQPLPFGQQGVDWDHLLASTLANMAIRAASGSMKPISQKKNRALFSHLERRSAEEKENNDALLKEREE